VNDQAVALLEILVAEIRGLREDMNRPGRRLAAPDREALVGLLPILAAAVADRAFTVRELRDHASLPNQLVLRGAIEASGGPNKLGRLLKRGDGFDVAGWRVERIGNDRDGLVWRMRAATGRA
jgi:hypothetical protein